MKNVMSGVIAAMVFACGTAAASPFTYQGELRDGGVPANGVYDLQLSLFSAAAGGDRSVQRSALTT